MLPVQLAPARITEKTMTMKRCPNGECLNFGHEFDTEQRYCLMCAWELAIAEQTADSVKCARDPLERKDQAA